MVKNDVEILIFGCYLWFWFLMDIMNIFCLIFRLFLIGEENDDIYRRKNEKKYFLFGLFNIKNSVKD